MGDQDENRKRSHQEDIDAALNSKRAALGGSESTENNLYFKLLCPAAVTGLIIGRGGSIINQLNSSTGAKIKLSQNHEIFPTTDDRVLVLNGSKEAIANAIKELVTRMSEAPDKRPPIIPMQLDMFGNYVPIPNAQKPPPGTIQARIIIPAIAAGTLIGKGGSVIKHMSDISQCKMQLGDGADPYNTKERLVFINAMTIPNLVLGCQTAMAQLLSEPKVRTYANLTTNYNNVPGLTNMPPVPMIGGYRPPVPQLMSGPANVPMNGTHRPNANPMNYGGTVGYGNPAGYGGMPASYGMPQSNGYGQYHPVAAPVTNYGPAPMGQLQNPPLYIQPMQQMGGPQQYSNQPIPVQQSYGAPQSYGPSPQTHQHNNMNGMNHHYGNSGMKK